MCQKKEQAEWNKNWLPWPVRCVLYFVLSLLTDTAVPLSHGEDRMRRGENCTGQLNIETVWQFCLSRSQMCTRAMIFPIFTFLVLISSTAKGSLQITNHEYHLMHFTKLISEQNFHSWNSTGSGAAHRVGRRLN
jgi:hypothetical protein